MSLVAIPDYVARNLDAHCAKFRALFPEATDEDAESIRQQLLDALLTYGHIPEFEFTRTENPSPPASGESYAAT